MQILQPMPQKVTCICLRSVKYSDSRSVATLWTRELGVLSAVIPSGTGREASRRRAIMMPMRVFEAVAWARQGQELARISDVKPVPAPLSSDPAAGAVALFVSDFLCSALRQSGPDELMSDFIFSSAAELYALGGTALANFHLYFLSHLGRFLGIEPDMGTYAPGSYFDMREGRFCAAAPLHRSALAPEQARVVCLLMRLRPRSLRLLRLSRAERNAILDAILEYYTIHYAPMRSLPSLPILRTLF